LAWPYPEEVLWPEEAGRLDVGVTVREPKLNMTLRSIAKFILILLVGYYIIGTVWFLILVVIDRTIG
jgi:hypothetical protein